jgi:hypothetical protein
VDAEYMPNCCHSGRAEVSLLVRRPHTGIADYEIHGGDYAAL